MSIPACRYCELFFKDQIQIFLRVTSHVMTHDYGYIHAFTDTCKHVIHEHEWFYDPVDAIIRQQKGLNDPVGLPCNGCTLRIVLFSSSPLFYLPSDFFRSVGEYTLFLAGLKTLRRFLRSSRALVLIFFCFISLFLPYSPGLFGFWVLDLFSMIVVKAYGKA